MNWFEKILNSDAGRGSRARAEEMVKEAGGSLPKVADPPPVCDTQEGSPASLDDLKGEVVRGEFS